MRRKNLISNRENDPEVILDAENVSAARKSLQEKLDLFSFHDGYINQLGSCSFATTCSSPRPSWRNSSASFKKVKDRLTVLLIVLAGGTKKPPEIIGNEKMPASRCYKKPPAIIGNEKFPSSLRPHEKPRYIYMSQKRLEYEMRMGLHWTWSQTYVRATKLCDYKRRRESLST